MRKIIPIILLGGAAVALFFLSRAGAARNLKVNFNRNKADWKKGSWLPVIFAEFNLINGSNTPLSLNSIVGEIIVNNQVVATVSMLEKMTIPANSASVLNVKVETSATGAGQVLLSLLQKKQKINVEFNGTVNSSGIQIPINQTIAL